MCGEHTSCRRNRRSTSGQSGDGPPQSRPGILIDCGVPFKALSGVKKDLKLVLLTHAHGDHFKPRTVRALHRERPALRWGCCEWMVGPLLEAGVDKRVIDVLTPGFCSVYKSLCTVMPEGLVHDVPNCGYHLILTPEHSRRERLFYATDTATLDGVEARGYDLYLIEANHIRDELEARARAKMEKGEFAYEGRAAANHLSQEQTLDWFYQQMGPHSQYVFLHQHKERSVLEHAEQNISARTALQKSRTSPHPVRHSRGLFLAGCGPGF